jgi:hypothetical protein
MSDEIQHWFNVDTRRPDTAYYSVLTKNGDVNGMDALKALFPDARADYLNFVLFSTSGVHGTYTTIEDAENFINGIIEHPEDNARVTFLIIHPRIVGVRYGNCDPETMDDIRYLKALRATSHDAIRTIGND